MPAEPGLTHADPVDDRLRAEELPARYRAVLDGVARLERIGERQAAWRIRRSATAAYSDAWNEQTLRRLDKLDREATRLLADHPRAAMLTGLWSVSEPA
jgi:hypothetical protein